MKELDYYARTEQWDKIVESSQGSLTNYLNMCFLNLALSQKGELADRLFSFDQRGPQGIMVGWNKTEQISSLLSDIAFCHGNPAMAQEMAFEAYATAIGEGTPYVKETCSDKYYLWGISGGGEVSEYIGEYILL